MRPPRLTTVAVPLAQIGAKSIRLALAKAATAPESSTRETVLGKLVTRNSTAVREH